MPVDDRPDEAPAASGDRHDARQEPTKLTDPVCGMAVTAECPHQNARLRRGTSTSLVRDRWVVHTPRKDPSSPCIVGRPPASTRDSSYDIGRNTPGSVRTSFATSHIACHLARTHSGNRHWRTKAAIRLGLRSFHCWAQSRKAPIGRSRSGRQQRSATPATRRSPSQQGPGQPRTAQPFASQRNAAVRRGRLLGQ